MDSVGFVTRARDHHASLLLGVAYTGSHKPDWAKLTAAGKAEQGASASSAGSLRRTAPWTSRRSTARLPNYERTGTTMTRLTFIDAKALNKLTLVLSSFTGHMILRPDHHRHPPWPRQETR